MTFIWSNPVAGKNNPQGGPFRICNEVTSALDKEYGDNLVVISGEGAPAPAESLAAGEAFDTISSMSLEDEILKQFPKIDTFFGIPYDSLLQMRVLKRLQPKAKKVLLATSTEPRYAHTVVTPEYQKNGINDPPYSEIQRWRVSEEQKLADVIIAAGEFSANTWRISPDMKGKKVFTVDFGVDSTVYRAAKDFPTDKLRILFAGGNILRKGLPYLFDAWQNLNGTMLISKREGLQLTILGADKKNFAPKLPNNIIIRGWVPEKDVPLIFRTQNLFILPSIEEGQALAVWEALASGLPVVTTVESGFGNIIKDGKQGFLIKSHDPIAIREKIQYFLDNPSELKKMSRNARQLAEQYPWERFTKEVIRVLREEL